MDYPTDSMWSDTEFFDYCVGIDRNNDDEYNAALADAMDDAYTMAVEPFNNAIEDYLLEIDKKYGTKYCPTGFARLR